MLRAQIYLTEQERKYLSAFSLKTGRSQSELIREAIDQFIENNSKEKSHIQDTLHAAKGLWAERDDLPDFNSIRREFDRQKNHKKKGEK